MTMEQLFIFMEISLITEITFNLQNITYFTDVSTT